MKKRDFIYITIIVILLLIIVIPKLKFNQNKKVKVAITSFITVPKDATSGTYYSQINDFEDLSETYEQITKDDNAEISLIEDTMVYKLTYKCNDLSDKECVNKANEVCKNLTTKIGKIYHFDNISIVDKAYSVSEIKDN